MKLTAIVVAALTVPLLLLVVTAVGFASAVAADGATSPDVEPGQIAADDGHGGCVVHDPSGTGGCVTPTLARLMAQVRQQFGPLPVACWSARGGDPYSDHPKGRACDYTIGRIGAYPGPADVRRGWALAVWLQTNALQLRVDYVFWQGRIWSRARAAEGWRPYTGGGRYSALGPTNGHYDHVHVSTIS